MSSRYHHKLHHFFTNKIIAKSIGYLIFATLILIPIFGGLGKSPLHLWDESRLAISAYEMLQDGNYLIPHYRGEPDMWSTKPPLMIWLQVLSFKIFGVNEFAVRFPAALAAFCTCLFLLFFVNHLYKNFFLGFVATMLLVTSIGYIGYHGARTGDYDALLTLFLTISGGSFFLFCENEHKKWLYLFFITTALAVLTKSVAGLMFLPAIAIYALLQKKALSLLKNRDFYIGIAIFVIFTISYYIGRELLNPGYLHAVFQNEWGGRYLQTLEGHGHPFFYFHHNFMFYRFSPWYFFIPAGIVASFFTKNTVIKRVTLFASIITLSFFLIISSSQTKLLWYDLPIYPFMVLLILPLFDLMIQLFNRIKKNRFTPLIRLIPYIILVALLIVPYIQMVNKNFSDNRKHYIWHGYEINLFLKEALQGKYDLDNHFVVHDGYNQQYLFYFYLLKEKGVTINFKSKENLQKENQVILFQDNIKTYVEQHYQYKITHQYGNVFTYFIEKKIE